MLNFLNGATLVLDVTREICKLYRRRLSILDKQQLHKHSQMHLRIHVAEQKTSCRNNIWECVCWRGDGARIAIATHHCKQELVQDHPNQFSAHTTIVKRC